MAKLARSQRTRGSADGSSSLLKVGDLLAGKYRVQRVLGEGGMGVVVAAYHELLDQRVAVKLLYQEVADREAQTRLLFEARAAARIQSDHVARVVDVDTGADGLPFIVMEMLEGGDLCDLVDARGALPGWVVADYVLQALEGLACAHAAGIIHRDLKPSNLFLATRPDGSQIIKILDFGISKSMEPEDGSTGRRRAMQLTGGRAVLGSPPYMSPEQVRSPKTVDHRTDIWALGVVMYELLTNSMPFGGGEIQETFAQILEKHPQPLRLVAPAVPEGLERVVARCLAKSREERFSDVAELARALAPFGSGAWAASADRVAATLARGFEARSFDEAASGPRLKGSSPYELDSARRVAIPSAPGRRSDSMQPELHGTASTVARRFPGFEYRSRAMLVAAAILGTAGVVLVAGTWLQRGHARAELGSEALTVPGTPPVDTAPLPAVGAGVIEPSLPPPAAEPSVDAVEPATEEAIELSDPEPVVVDEPPPPVTSTPRAAPAAPRRPSPAFAPRPRPRVAPVTSPTAASTPKNALPPDLPRDRR